MTHRLKLGVSAALVLATVTLWPALGTAQAPEPVPLSWTSVRFATLFMDFTRMYPEDWGVSGALVAVELSHRRPSGLLVEGISQLLINFDYLPISVAARVGYSQPLHGHAHQGSSSRGFLVGLLGYRYILEGGDYLLDNHNLQMGFAYDLSIGQRNAFAFRAYGVADLPISSKPQGDRDYYEGLNNESYHGGFQFGISLGMAFGR